MSSKQEDIIYSLLKKWNKFSSLSERSAIHILTKTCYVGIFAIIICTPCLVEGSSFIEQKMRSEFNHGFVMVGFGSSNNQVGIFDTIKNFTQIGSQNIVKFSVGNVAFANPVTVTSEQMGTEDNNNSSENGDQNIDDHDFFLMLMAVSLFAAILAVAESKKK